MEVRRKSILKMCPADSACEGCATCRDEGYTDCQGDHTEDVEKTVTIVDVRRVPPNDVSKWQEEADYVWEYFKVDLYDVHELDHMPVLSALGCDTSGFAKSKPENEFLKTVDNALKSIDRDAEAKGLSEDQFLEANDHFKSKLKSSKEGQCSLNGVLVRFGSILAQLGHEIGKGSNISSALCQETFSKLVQLTGFMSEAVSPDGRGKVFIEVKDNIHFAQPNFYINLSMPVSAPEDIPAKLLATVQVWGDEDPLLEESSKTNNNIPEEEDEGLTLVARPPSPVIKEAAAVVPPSEDPPTTYLIPALEDEDSDYIDTLDKDSDLAKISRSKFANLRLDESLKSVSDAWTCPPNCHLILDEEAIAAKAHLAAVFGDMLCTYKQRNIFEWSAEGCDHDYRLGFSVRYSKVQVVAMEMLSDVAHQLSSHQMVRHHHIPLYVSPEYDLLKRDQRNKLFRFLLQLKYTGSALNPW